jgi:hypothetical protein
VIGFTVFLDTSFQLATLCALILPLGLVLNYSLLISDPNITRDQTTTQTAAAVTAGGAAGQKEKEKKKEKEKEVRDSAASRSGSADSSSDDNSSSSSDSSDSRGDVELLLRPFPSPSPSSSSSSSSSPSLHPGEEGRGGCDLSLAAASLTTRERLDATLALWPYMLPLCLVYFAEYAMQSGVWAAIGERVGVGGVV